MSGTLARCNSTGKTFDVGTVEVVQRYADCSVFKCPACHKTHDDRRAWHGPAEARMGYTMVGDGPSGWAARHGWAEQNRDDAGVSR